MMHVDALSLVQDLYRVLALVSAPASPSTVSSRTPTNRAEKQNKHEGKKHRQKDKQDKGMSIPVQRGTGEDRGRV